MNDGNELKVRIGEIVCNVLFYLCHNDNMLREANMRVKG